MDFRKCLFWICFTIIIVTFTVCNPILTFKSQELTLKRTEPVQYFGPVIWKNIHIETRSIKNVDIFKTEIRNWKPTNCSYRLCETLFFNWHSLNTRLISHYEA